MTTENRPDLAADAPVAEQLPVGIFRKDAVGRFIFVNACYCQLMASPAAQILGLRAEDVAEAERQNPNTRWSAEGAARQAQHHRLLMQTGQPVEREEIHADANGQSRYFQVVESVVLRPDQTIDGTQGIVFEITRFKHTDLALTNEGELLRALLDNSPDHIYFKDLQSRFIKSSSAQALQFGMSSPDGLVGKSDFDVFSDEHARPAYEDEQAIIRTGVPMIGKVERETWLDGRPDSWALTTKMALRTRQGEIIGTFGVTKDISELKEAERRAAEAHRQMLVASRLAGMAEIATNVLHNVGNVLNSINVSAGIVSTRLHASKLKGLARAVGLMNEHKHDLGEFLTGDPKGRLLPNYLAELAKTLEAEQESMAEELRALSKSVDHIKEVVATQQSHAGSPRVVELLKVSDLVDDALRMSSAALTRHGVNVVQDMADLPLLSLDRHRVLLILINLINNAKNALNSTPEDSRLITIHASLRDAGTLALQVADNGGGIAPEHLTCIFSHGFTTRKDGHGFGLHSSALAAGEMGGRLAVTSDGPGKGACFVLELPIQLADVPPETGAAMRA